MCSLQIFTSYTYLQMWQTFFPTESTGFTKFSFFISQWTIFSWISQVFEKGKVFNGKFFTSKATIDQWHHLRQQKITSLHCDFCRISYFHTNCTKKCFIDRIKLYSQPFQAGSALYRDRIMRLSHSTRPIQAMAVPPPLKARDWISGAGTPWAPENKMFESGHQVVPPTCWECIWQYLYQRLKKKKK